LSNNEWSHAYTLI
jgi:hypothetical protein